MLPTHQFLYENAHVPGDCVVIVRLQVESVLWYLLIECIVHWQLIGSCLCNWLGVHLGVRKCFVSFSLVVFVYTCACVCLHEKWTWLRVCVLVFVCTKNGPGWEFVCLCLFARKTDLIESSLCLITLLVVFVYTSGCVCLRLCMIVYTSVCVCLYVCLIMPLLVFVVV